MQCAQCHDHKYDPITQKDFYSMYAFFNNFDVQPETPGWPENGLQEPYISLASAEQESKLKKVSKSIASVEQKIKRLDDKLGTLAESSGTDSVSQKNSRVSAKMNRRIKQLNKKKVELENELKALKSELMELKRKIPYALVSKERDEVKKTFLLERGEYDNLGEEVPRSTPGFLPPLKPAGSIPSRLDLANWFVADDHPLTSRVAVNRIWQSLMGMGLVKTSEDFGAQGTPPSHRMLLDYLADDFRRNGWDTKRLVKLIASSKTYRQSSRVDNSIFRNDPDNRDLARAMRYRLDAEVLRDQLLFVSGKICNDMYGPSVKPPQPDGLWKAVTMIGERYKADGGSATTRRSVYTFWKRGMPPPQMTILNAPGRDACVARRERTNTPSQALLLLNETAYFEAAAAFAERVLSQPEEQRITFAWESVTGKLPDEQEIAVVEQLLEDLRQSYSAQPELAEQIKTDSERAASKSELAAWTVVANTLFNLDITKNRD
jgi:hypothetical protein